MSPKTLTPDEFQRLRPGGSYKKYRSYLRRVRPGRLRAMNAWRTDPFALIPERQIPQIARRDIMPGVRAEQREIEAAYRREIESGSGRIRGFTDELMQALAPYDARIAGYYGDAQASGAAVGDALRSALAGGGARDAAGLGAKLGAINAPSAQVEEVAGGAARTGEGAAGATFGLSSADLERLAGERTAHGVYAAKQPGIAGLRGLQEMGRLERDLGGELADKLGELRGGVPGAISERIAQLRESNYDRGLARASGIGDVQKDKRERQRELADERRRRRQELIDARLERGQELTDAQRERQQELADAARERQEEIFDDQRERAEDAKQDPQERADFFYEARGNAIAQAREYANRKTKNPNTGLEVEKPIPKAEARRRLWTEYGAMLVGRGYKRTLVQQMIDRALAAAGY